MDEPSAKRSMRAKPLTILLTLGAIAILAITFAVQFSFRELRLEILSYSHEVATEEAQSIAEAIQALGRTGSTLDWQRLEGKLQLIRNFLEERLEDRPHLRQVELTSPAGEALLFAMRDLRTGRPTVLVSPPVGGDQMWLEIPIASGVRLGEGEAVGELRVGLEEDNFERRLSELRKSLALRIGIASAFGVLVIFLGGVYLVFLQRKNKRLEQSRAAAERRSYVGLLASGLAHEIRNPLNAMNMNLQMLEEEMLEEGDYDADHLELLESTKREIKRLESLVNNFLTYARPARPHFERKDLNELLNDIALFLQADFNQSGVGLKLELEPMLPDVEMDETQLKQAIMNLLVNARQVLKGEGAVTMRSRVGTAGDVVIEISDNGPGIPEEDQEKIFEVFYSNRGGGTGLGLPIARQILARHGGSLELASKEGVGTTFFLHLPRTHSPMVSTTDKPEATK